MSIMTSDLIKIAAAGGGMRIDCKKRMVSDIIRIASNASQSRACILLVNTDSLQVSDLLRIAGAGKGCVIFDDVQ